jgi:toxin CcdB
MAQFNVYLNTNNSTKNEYPYLVDIQSPLLETLDTRLVIPLILLSKMNSKPIKGLTPVFKIKGNEYILLTSQMAGIHKKYLGRSHISDFSNNRQEIISAIDFLLSGF